MISRNKKYYSPVIKLQNFNNFNQSSISDVHVVLGLVSEIDDPCIRRLEYKLIGLENTIVSSRSKMETFGKWSIEALV